MALPGSRAVLVAALALSLAAAALFALHAAGRGHQIAATGDEPVRPWMSIPYIAHSKHVSENLLWKAVGIPPHAHDRRPIGRIARYQHRPVSELIHALQLALKTASKDAPE